jgi:chorismate mutase / prephenate dehydratase
LKESRRVLPRAAAERIVDRERAKIDRLDERILALLNQRARIAQRIGRSKARNGGGDSFWVPSREKRIFERLRTLNDGPLGDDDVRAIFREVISASRALEARPRVAYLGPEGTFAHAAAREQFGSAADLSPATSIPAVFAEVEHGRAEFGVVPVENSTEGPVPSTLDLLIDSKLQITAEILLEVRQSLMGTAAGLREVRRVLSHPQGLAQCRRWLAAHLPGVPLEETASTARAAELASADRRVAAIAGRAAAERYGLRVLAADIHDEVGNATRFLVLGAGDVRAAAGDDKTSIVCTVKDEVGVLARLLEPLARERVSLSKIESRPLRGKPWEYVFFLDLDGHRSEARVKRALARMQPLTSSMRVLGSYPAARSKPPEQDAMKSARRSTRRGTR